MSTFSKSTFNATKYAASRPHYPPSLYAHVLKYAALDVTTSSPKTLVDVGCGPGLSTFAFSPHFDRIIGIDPSENMVNAARSILKEREISRDIEDGGKFSFEKGKVDELGKIEGIQEGSVDLIVAGQAAHWFDPLPSYKSLAKVLKPGGSFVFWGYGEIFFPQRPELSALIPPYSGQLLGPYWEQPGRSIVENLLIPFPLPLATNFSPSSSRTKDEIESTCSQFDLDSLQRTFHLEKQSSLPSLLPSEERASIKIHVEPSLLLTKNWTLKGLEGYLRTWSSLHKYQEEKGTQPDIVEELLEKLREKGWKDEEEVEAAWQVGMVMGKKKRQ